VTPVDGNPPVRVAETVVEVPTVMGEVATAVVSEVMLVGLTVTLAQVPVNGLLLMSPPYDAW
jgi:hypothetical protein